MPAHPLPLPFPGKPSRADSVALTTFSLRRGGRTGTRAAAPAPRLGSRRAPQPLTGRAGAVPEGRLPPCARAWGCAPGRLRTYLRLGGFGRLHQVLLLVQRPEANVGQENQSRGEEQRHLQKPLLFPLHGQSRAALLAAAVVSAPPAPRGARFSPARSPSEGPGAAQKLRLPHACPPGARAGPPPAAAAGPNLAAAPPAPARCCAAAVPLLGEFMDPPANGAANNLPRRGRGAVNKYIYIRTYIHIS